MAWLYINSKGLQNILGFTFNNFGPIPSGPGAFLGFNLVISVSISLLTMGDRKMILLLCSAYNS